MVATGKKGLPHLIRAPSPRLVQMTDGRGRLHSEAPGSTQSAALSGMARGGGGCTSIAVSLASLAWHGEGRGGGRGLLSSARTGSLGKRNNGHGCVVGGASEAKSSGTCLGKPRARGQPFLAPPPRSPPPTASWPSFPRGSHNTHPCCLLRASHVFRASGNLSLGCQSPRSGRAATPGCTRPADSKAGAGEVGLGGFWRGRDRGCLPRGLISVTQRLAGCPSRRSPALPGPGLPCRRGHLISAPRAPRALLPGDGTPGTPACWGGAADDAQGGRALGPFPCLQGPQQGPSPWATGLFSFFKNNHHRAQGKQGNPTSQARGSPGREGNPGGDGPRHAPAGEGEPNKALPAAALWPGRRADDGGGSIRCGEGPSATSLVHASF